MNKPDKVYPSSPKTIRSPFPNIISDPSIRSKNFEEILQNRGIRFIHRRATPCPNIATLDDRGHDPNCNICEDGFVLYGDREIWGVFMGDSLEKLYEIQGEWEIGQAIITFPAEYNTGEQADFGTFDQLIVPDFTMRLWELKEFRVTADGKQRLRYPVVNSDFVAAIDSTTDTLVEFTEGVDFNVVDGDIVWVDGKEPPVQVDPATGTQRGQVVTYSYFAEPRFTVQHMMHELRASQELDEATGEKVARRLPQQVLVRKDFIVRPQANIDGTEGA